MELRHPYLTQQLIAYIGNKRALLPFLHAVLAETAGSLRGPVTFLDPFAGSGAVSRLAKMMGFSVAANDWEPYAFAINSCHIALSPGEVNRAFRGRGGLERVLAELNSLPPPAPADRYIARHYAPRSTEGADWMTERLFYTTENALRLDAVRQRIEEMYPGSPRNPDERTAKTALLAPLLYEAATHTNTSGVFKACHRGFGGHGRDALTRIMAPIRLEPPVLLARPAASTAACEDAVTFLEPRPADICYLDPPYAVHQYGSNYFMLNSIALWDRPPVSEERGPDGRLVHKAGIRSDWTRTRSPFCYASSAREAMSEVLRAADCRYLVVSYSDEGLIGLEELCDLLSETGSLSARSTSYVKYPGGRQSRARRTSNAELALVVDRRTRPVPARTRMILREAAAARLFSRAFDPRRIRASFRTEPGAILVETAAGSHRLPMHHHWRFAPGARPPVFATSAEAERFVELLGSCEVADVKAEIEVLVDAARAEMDEREKRRLLREVLRLFNKLAHRKYAADLSEVRQSLEGFARELADPGAFRLGIGRVMATAARRAERAERT